MFNERLFFCNLFTILQYIKIKKVKMDLTIKQIDLIIEAIDTRIQCWILLNLEKSEVQDLKDLRNKLMFDKIEIQKRNDK